jgi:hypothetical protein
MGILNSIPGYKISGENGNTLYDLYCCARDLELTQIRNSKNSERPTHPWYGLAAIDTQSFKEKLAMSFVEEVLRPEARTRVTGFKEIRTSETVCPDLMGYTKFLLEVFPKSKIVINHRNLTDVAASKWWADTPNAFEKIKSTDDRLREIQSDENIFHFEYEKHKDAQHLAEFFGFLGEKVNMKRIERVLDQKHSY